MLAAALGHESVAAAAAPLLAARAAVAA